MANLPNGLTADAESIGMLFYKQLGIFQLLKANPNLEHITHVRQCLNALRCGERLKVISEELPKTKQEIKGVDWLKLDGAWHEFRRTWSESRIVLDMTHISWCLDQLGKGLLLEFDLEPNFRPVSEQLDTFIEFNKIVAGEKKHNPGYREIAEADFDLVKKAIEAGAFSPGDLLFYCQDGNTLLTAEMTRTYMNRWVGGIYSGEHDTPCLRGNPEDIKGFGNKDIIVRESANSRQFFRPNGFYVKRLPEFADGNRFATSKDFDSVIHVESATASRWPMTCEAFQLFGVTHKCWSDMRRPDVFALPGFYIKEWDHCHTEIKDPFSGLAPKVPKMLTIGQRSSLSLGKLCLKTNLKKETGIAFGFLEPWTAGEEKLPKNIYDAYCENCRKKITLGGYKPLYLFEGFGVCSFCGSIQKHETKKP